MTLLFIPLALLAGVSFACLITYFLNYEDDRPDLGGFGGRKPD